MVNIFQAVIVILAGLSVALADALIKKISANTTLILALKNPLMILIVFLYIVQIILFAYVFVNQWQLGVVGIMQMAAYSIFILATGYFIFNETLTAIQYVGIILAIGGIVLINA